MKLLFQLCVFSGGYKNVLFAVSQDQVSLQATIKVLPQPQGLSTLGDEAQ